MKAVHLIDIAPLAAVRIKAADAAPTLSCLGPTPGGGWIDALLRLFKWK